jgi:hypothetical protein
MLAMRFAGLLFAGLLLFALLPSTSLAQSRAKELAEWCRHLRDVRPEGRNVKVPQDFRAGYCVGVFHSLRFIGGKAVRARAADSRAYAFCPGPDVTQFDLIRTFIAFVEANPATANRPAISGARDALARAYPCTSQRL